MTTSLKAFRKSTCNRLNHWIQNRCKNRFMHSKLRANYLPDNHLQRGIRIKRTSIRLKISQNDSFRTPRMTIWVKKESKRTPVKQESRRDHLRTLLSLPGKRIWPLQQWRKSMRHHRRFKCLISWMRSPFPPTVATRPQRSRVRILTKSKIISNIINRVWLIWAVDPRVRASSSPSQECRRIESWLTWHLR